jgi:hypothetical protein
MCTSSHAPSRKRQITVRFTGHSRIVGPQYANATGSLQASTIWRMFLEFGKSVDPLGTYIVKIVAIVAHSKFIISKTLNLKIS